MITSEPKPQAAPHIRTFHPRRGRMGAVRADALARLWPRYGYDIDPRGDLRREGTLGSVTGGGVDLHGDGTPGATPVGFDQFNQFDQFALFGRTAPLVLEIGCGMGEATAAMAAADPDRDYLAADVHTPGLANLLALAERGGLGNVRAARGDAVELLRDLMKPGSLAAVHVFFPDPWPKARHHKRRIVRPEVVALIRERLVTGGRLHCATDWQPYAEQMAEVLGADPGLRPLYDGYAPRPAHRPVTKFERRALAAGREVFDLVYAKA